MPKRSNEFQQLLHVIQVALAHEAQVTESAMLVDSQTGDEVEVDVLVEAKVGNTPINLGFEIRDQSRPATVEWVREMSGKHRDLPVDKTILVSRSGFTTGASRKAESLGIDLLTVSEASDVDWIQYLSSLNLQLRGFRFTLVDSTITLADPTDLDDDISLSPDSIISEPGNSETGTLNQYANALINREDIAQNIMQTWMQTTERAQEYGSAIDWNAPKGTTVRDAHGALHEVARLRCRIRVSVGGAALSWRPAKIRDASIAIGESANVFSPESEGRFIVVATEKDGKLSTGAVRFPESGEVRRTIPNEKDDA